MSNLSAILELQNVEKRYGANSLAVADLSLSIRRGEVVCLLGPSGCGKTTTLRMVAGFAPPTRGSILIEGKNITASPPHHRDVGLIFQNYALFPHLNVEENIAFGLRSVRTPTAERQDRVQELLRIVQLEQYAARYPRELSGGQQQRVAFARALALRPAVLLLDEPFSNLDAQLRLHMREEVRSLIDRLGITAIFVTHDQEEALAIADRIVLMNEGRIEQEGAPRDIYEAPKTRFVAEFIGRCNVISGSVAPDGSKFTLESGIQLNVEGQEEPGPAVAAIRPEHIAVSYTTGGSGLAARVERTVYRGPTTYLYVHHAGTELLVEAASSDVADLAAGAEVSLAIEPRHLRVLR